MWEWITGIAYYAHGYCLSWDPWLIGLHGGSDLLIFGAYTAIPIAILIFIKRRPQLEMKGLARFFAAFIFWCGLTHLFGFITLWFPIYDIQALVKAATAAVSIVTAVVIFMLIPKALAIPSPRELQLVNDRLRSEIGAHQQTLDELHLIRGELEARVEERTRELSKAADHAKTLTREIAHRAGNLMSVIAAMARQSLRSPQPPEQFVSQFVGRIEGMGRSHELLFKQSWQKLDLKALVVSQLAPFLGERPAQVSGPQVNVDPDAVHNLSMVFYELATNATKHGALSTAGGNIGVSWQITQDAAGEDRIDFEWRETGGPLVAEPERMGWGTRVIRQMAAHQLNGESELTFNRDGLVWKLSAPLHGGSIGSAPPGQPSLE
jgi:two-component sensor histidine kinase